MCILETCGGKKSSNWYYIEVFTFWFVRNCLKTHASLLWVNKPQWWLMSCYFIAYDGGAHFQHGPAVPFMNVHLSIKMWHTKIQLWDVNTFRDVYEKMQLCTPNYDLISCNCKPISGHLDFIPHNVKSHDVISQKYHNIYHKSISYIKNLVTLFLL